MISVLCAIPKDGNSIYIYINIYIYIYNFHPLALHITPNSIKYDTYCFRVECDCRPNACQYFLSSVL